MQRVIYIVEAKIINGAGTLGNMTGYPKTFDSTSYDNDTAKTERRAKAAYHAALADMYAQDGRQMQTAYIAEVGSNNMRWSETDGAIAEVEPPVEGEGE